MPLLGGLNGLSRVISIATFTATDRLRLKMSATAGKASAMTDPLIELAREVACDVWGLDGSNRQAVMNGEFDNIRQVQSALSALRTQKAMIAEWFNRMPCCQEQGGPGCHPARCDTCTRNYADAIEQNAYLKGRG